MPMVASLMVCHPAPTLLLRLAQQRCQALDLDQGPTTMRGELVEPFEEDAQSSQFQDMGQREHYPLDRFPHLTRRRRRLLGTPWIRRVLRRGYALQFSRRPPPFCGILQTMLRSPKDAVALHREVNALRVLPAALVPPSTDIGGDRSAGGGLCGEVLALLGEAAWTPLQ
uniref:Uncharacterized protein n=1 Tax=Knipowitschia caucasica TaxID=637954 RepID=A0AAV2KQZ2_KNICA